MANEAAVTVILRMHDEASVEMQNFGQATQQAQIEAIQFNAAMTAMGSAMTAVGALLGKVDDPMAKMASNFLMTAGAVLTTTSAIIQMLPYIRQMVRALRNWAVAQAILQALSGPGGWATLGIGLGIAAGAAAGVYALSGGFGGGGGTTVNVTTDAFMGSSSDARRFAEKTQRYSRENTRLGR